jgi:hypothetical protein
LNDDATSDRNGVPADAELDAVPTQSPPSTGQFDPGYHSATRLRLSTLVAFTTYNRNVADVTVALSGNAEVSNRTNPTPISYPLKIGPARRTANDDPDADGSGDVAGGYPNPVPILFTRTSPSSAPADTTNVIDPDDETAVTVKVAGEVAELVPSLTTTGCAPTDTEGIVNDTVAFPLASVVAPDPTVADTPPTRTDNRAEAANPVALIDAAEPTAPLEGLKPETAG